MTKTKIEQAVGKWASLLLNRELLSSTGWMSSGWTGSFSLGFTHTVGNLSILSNSVLASVYGNYQISYSVASRTAGTFTISFGGYVSSAISASGSATISTSNTESLKITPTTDFDGKVTISIKQTMPFYISNQAQIKPNGSFLNIKYLNGSSLGVPFSQKKDSDTSYGMEYRTANVRVECFGTDSLDNIQKLEALNQTQISIDNQKSNNIVIVKSIMITDAPYIVNETKYAERAIADFQVAYCNAYEYSDISSEQITVEENII